MGNICQVKLADYESNKYTSTSGLEEIPAESGYAPVPADQRAQDFDSAISRLTAATQHYGAVHNNAIQAADAQQAVTEAKAAVATAAEAVGASACGELARRGTY